MRRRWIEDVLRQPVDSLHTVHGHAEWRPIHQAQVQGKARLELCAVGDRRVVGVTITRLGRIKMRGLFDAPDIAIQSRSDAHVDLVIATGPRQAVSLLHIDTLDSEQITAFLER